MRDSTVGVAAGCGGGGEAAAVGDGLEVGEGAGGDCARNSVTRPQQSSIPTSEKSGLETHFINRDWVR